MILLSNTYIYYVGQNNNPCSICTLKKSSYAAIKNLSHKKRNYKVADPILLSALARIGGNLNQIARQVNTVESDIEKIKAFAQLAMIREQLQEVLENYDR